MHEIYNSLDIKEGNFGMPFRNGLTVTNIFLVDQFAIHVSFVSHVGSESRSTQCTVSVVSFRFF